MPVMQLLLHFRKFPKSLINGPASLYPELFDGETTLWGGSGGKSELCSQSRCEPILPRLTTGDHRSLGDCETKSGAMNGVDSLCRNPDFALTDRQIDMCDRTIDELGAVFAVPVPSKVVQTYMAGRLAQGPLCDLYVRHISSSETYTVETWRISEA
jgi:hypothetical protein